MPNSKSAVCHRCKVNGGVAWSLGSGANQSVSTHGFYLLNRPVMASLVFRLSDSSSLGKLRFFSEGGGLFVTRTRYTRSMRANFNLSAVFPFKFPCHALKIRPLEVYMKSTCLGLNAQYNLCSLSFNVHGPVAQLHSTPGHGGVEDGLCEFPLLD